MRRGCASARSSGEFSQAQRQVYDLVHAAHVAALDAVRPGAPYGAAQRVAMRTLAEGLHEWGLLTAGVDEALSAGGRHHRRYIVSRTGHLLGLDVHDCAAASPVAYRAGTLEPGMALTVEPGLYFPAHDATLPPELRGIGVRIEDDVVVTASGAEVLSDALPITADGIERWVASHCGHPA